MDDAFADPAAPNGSVFVADFQTQGRGARGANWSADAGAQLTFTILLHDAELAWLSLRAGVAIANAIDGLLPSEIERSRIKWPNDVWVAGAKLSGILAEARTGTGKTRCALGIGINVQAQRVENAASTSLAELGVDISRKALLGHVLRELERSLAIPPIDIVASVSSRLLWIGERVRCGEVVGQLRGLSHEGGIIVRTDDDERRVLNAGRLRLAE